MTTTLPREAISLLSALPRSLRRQPAFTPGRHHRGWGFEGGHAVVRFVVAIVLGAGVEAIVYMSFLTVRPLTAADVLGFVLFQWGPLLLWLGIGLGSLPMAKPWLDRMAGRRARAREGGSTTS
jgi:hypothetical protein